MALAGWTSRNLGLLEVQDVYAGWGYLGLPPITRSSGIQGYPRCWGYLELPPITGFLECRLGLPGATSDYRIPWNSEAMT